MSGKNNVSISACVDAKGMITTGRKESATNRKAPIFHVSSEETYKFSTLSCLCQHYD